MGKTRMLRRVHTWLGVSGAVFWLVVGSTGMLLTFRTSMRKPVPEAPPLARWVDRAEPEEIVSDLGTRFEEPQISRLHFATRAKPLWRVELTTPPDTTIYYSGDGKHLATVVDERWFAKLLFKIHTGGIAGRPGEVFSALLGAILLASIVTGILIWPWLLKANRRRQ